MASRNPVIAGLAAALVYLSILTCEAQLQKGIASYYGSELAGRATANGEYFNPNGFTCASWYYPFGTLLRVRHKKQSVIVRVNDRGPARHLGRIIDLSEASFAALADTKLGLIPVIIERVK